MSSPERTGPGRCGPTIAAAAAGAAPLRRLRCAYHKPRSLDEALALAGRLEGSRYVAGGTDLIVRMRAGLERAEALISLRWVPELAGISGDGETRLGGSTTFSEILEHAWLGARHPLLALAARTLGSRQVRNVATVGGNLCNAIPCADSAVALLALEARARLVGPAGARELPLEEIFVGPRQTRLAPGEILESVLIPARDGRSSIAFLKKTRVARDLALVSLAASLDWDEPRTRCRKARLAAGSVAPVPMRLRRVEALVEGQVLTPDLIARARDIAREEVRPISDVRASADYRRHITGVLLQRGLETALAGRAS